MSRKPAAEKLRLPTSANVVRYVGGSNFDPTTGKVNGGAFDRTAKDVDGLSVTQRLVISSDSDGDKLEIRKVFASRMTLGKTAMFAELNVGKALKALEQFEEDFHFLANPLPAIDKELANPAHALLIGLPFVGEAVGSLKSELAGDLLRNVVHGMFPANLPAVWPSNSIPPSPPTQFS